MSRANFGTAHIDIRVDQSAVDREARKVEQRFEKVGKDTERGVGASIARAFTIGAGVVASIKSIEIISGLIKGHWEGVADAIYSLPLGLGEAARALGSLIDKNITSGQANFAADIFDFLGLSGAAANVRELSRPGVDPNANVEQLRRERYQTEGAKRLEQLNRQLEIERATTDEEKKRVQIQQQFKAATKGLDNFAPFQREQILAAAEEQRRLQLAALDKKAATPGFGQQISARTALSNFAQPQDQPTRRQVDITNQTLQNLVRIVANLERNAVAQ